MTAEASDAARPFLPLSMQTMQQLLVASAQQEEDVLRIKEFKHQAGMRGGRAGAP